MVVCGVVTYVHSGLVGYPAEALAQARGLVGGEGVQVRVVQPHLGTTTN